MERAPGDEDGHVGGQAAQDGRAAERNDGHDEQTLAPETIGQRAGRHEDCRHGDGVGVHRPLELSKIGVKDVLQRRQDRRHA